MILNKNNVTKARAKRGFKEYTFLDGKFSIHCWGDKMLGTYIRWWTCKVNYTPLGYRPEAVFRFEAPQPWVDFRFLVELNEALNKKGKYALIKAIYNDLKA